MQSGELFAANIAGKSHLLQRLAHVALARRHVEMLGPIGAGAEDAHHLARRIAEITEEAVSGRASELGERLIPAKEARAALGNPDPSTMYRWSVLGYLTPVKIGVRNYYKASDLERIIRAHSIQVKP